MAELEISCGYNVYRAELSVSNFNVLRNFSDYKSIRVTNSWTALSVRKYFHGEKKANGMLQNCLVSLAHTYHVSFFC